MVFFFASGCCVCIDRVTFLSISIVRNFFTAKYLFYLYFMDRFCLLALAKNETKRTIRFLSAQILLLKNKGGKKLNFVSKVEFGIHLSNKRSSELTWVDCLIWSMASYGCSGERRQTQYRITRVRQKNTHTHTSPESCWKKKKTFTNAQRKRTNKIKWDKYELHKWPIFTPNYDIPLFVLCQHH